MWPIYQFLQLCVICLTIPLTDNIGDVSKTGESYPINGFSARRNEGNITADCLESFGRTDVVVIASNPQCGLPAENLSEKVLILVEPVSLEVDFLLGIPTATIGKEVSGADEHIEFVRIDFSQPLDLAVVISKNEEFHCIGRRQGNRTPHRHLTFSGVPSPVFTQGNSWAPFRVLLRYV